MLIVFLFIILAFSVYAAQDVFNLASSASPESTKLLQSLIEDGKSPNAITKGGESLLHLACIYGLEEKVRMLLQAGAEPNYRASLVKASLDMTPLTWCVYGGYKDSVQAYLADPRTNINLVVYQEDGNFLTALDIAYKIGESGSKIVEMLELAGGHTYEELLNIHQSNVNIPNMPPSFVNGKKETDNGNELSQRDKEL